MSKLHREGTFLPYKNNFILAAIITLFILFPDILANYYWRNYADHSLLSLLLGLVFTFLLAFFMTMTKKLYFVFFSLFFTLMGFIEIVYFAFFRSYMHTYTWNLIVETEDIIGSLKSIASMAVSAIVLLTIFLVLLHSIELFLKPKKSRYAAFEFFLILLLLFFGVIHENSQFPSKKYFSYINASGTAMLAIEHTLTPMKEKIFLPYGVIKNGDEKPIVIMIMGESLNSEKMHLFGFDYLDTPMLDQLKTDKNFQYKLAISSGINTVISIPMFFYIKREPKNKELIPSNSTNLMKLAKENGYSTYWLSTQDEEKEMKSILRYTDIKKIRSDWALPVYDDVLLNALKNINFNKKTFLVLHLRADHSPYENYTPPSYEKWKYDHSDYVQYKLSSYVDSVLYVDHIVASVINYMKTNHKNFVIYFTSDHGEMLGSKEENFKYGHSQLDINCAKVPFIYYSDVYKKNLNLSLYNHYTIAKMLSDDLGYKVENPNEDGSYFVNGVNTDGKWGAIEYTLPSDSNYSTVVSC